MRIVISCEAPSNLAGNYTFEYMSSVFDLFCQIPELKSDMRDGYMKLLKEYGFLEVRTTPYSFRITVIEELDEEKT